MLALFLGRHGHVKEALDICEPLWANPSTSWKRSLRGCIEVVNASDEDDAAQLDRVAGWLERALAALAASNRPECEGNAIPDGRPGQLPRTSEAKMTQRCRKTVISRAIEKACIVTRTRTTISPGCWPSRIPGERRLGGHRPSDRARRATCPIISTLEASSTCVLKRTRRSPSTTSKTPSAADPSPSRLFHLAQAIYKPTTRKKPRDTLERRQGQEARSNRFGPRGLHPLEQVAYQKLRSRIGIAMTGP